MLLISRFVIPETEGFARWALVLLLGAGIVGGAALTFYGWRLDRAALLRRQSEAERASETTGHP